MQALDATWQTACRDVRATVALVRDAQARSEAPEVVEALERHRDGALSRALAAREELTGIWQQREASRAAHLAKHAAEVVTDQPADEAAGPVRTDAWGADGRHLVSGSWWDEGGYSRAGFHRTTRRDALGHHELTGTLLSPSGHLPDGRHHTEAGLSYADAGLTTADDVVAGNVALSHAPKATSAARAIGDAKRSEKADAKPAKAAASRPATG